MMFAHPESLRQALSDTRLIRDKAFIAGEWVAGETTFPVYDPVTDKVIVNVANLQARDFTTAIESAHTAFKSFKSTQETTRAKLLHAWAALIRQNAKDLGNLLSLENGKTSAEAEGEVEYGASFITWFAEEAVRSYGDVIPSQHKGSANLVLRSPIGVCGIIAPWNFPIAMITRKLAPAFAAECTVVVKPPSETPLCTLALTDLTIEA